MGSFYVDENIDLPHLLEQSLRAHTVYERDKDYVVMPCRTDDRARAAQHRDRRRRTPAAR
jgi:hypothetical protein